MIRLLCHIHYCDEVDKLSRAEWPTAKEWTIVTKEDCEICRRDWQAHGGLEEVSEENIPSGKEETE